MVTLNRYAPFAALGLSLALNAAGCGGDDDDKGGNGPSIDGGPDARTGTDGGGNSSTDGGTQWARVVDEPVDEKGVYLYSVGLPNPAGPAFQYAIFRDKIDFNLTVDDLKKGREIAAYSGLAAIGNHIIIGEQEKPVATKWKIEDDLKTWTQVGTELSFSKYITDDTDGLNFYFQAIKGSDMFLYYGADRTSRAHWNVDQWTILGEYTDTKLPTVTAPEALGSTGNRSGVRDWKGPVTQSFGVSNEDTGLGRNESYIAVYDETTKAEKAVLTIPCPDIQQATKDEDGNLYYGTTFAGSLVPQLYGQTAPTCVVKIKPDGTQDTTFGQKQVEDLTGGFPGINFRYLRKGRALVNVLRTDKLAGVSFTGAIDPAVETRIAGSWDANDNYTKEDASIWETHLVDLATGTSKVVTGWENNLHTPNYMITFVQNNRAFVAAQFDPYGTPSNTIYEIDINDATLKVAGKVPGELGSFERVR